LIISVEKNRKGHIRELHEQICELQEMEGIKMILYVEHTVDANDLPTPYGVFVITLIRSEITSL
jgi:4-hydroxy-3-polyprenylbenzoate decarboxylase